MTIKRRFNMKKLPKKFDKETDKTMNKLDSEYPLPVPEVKKKDLNNDNKLFVESEEDFSLNCPIHGHDYHSGCSYCKEHIESEVCD